MGWKPKDDVPDLGGNERAVELDDGTTLRIRITRSETASSVSLKALATRVDRAGNPLDHRGQRTTGLPQETGEVATVMKDWLAGGDAEVKLNDQIAELTDRIIRKFEGHKAAAALWSVFPEE